MLNEVQINHQHNHILIYSKIKLNNTLRELHCNRNVDFQEEIF